MLLFIIVLLVFFLFFVCVIHIHIHFVCVVCFLQLFCMNISAPFIAQFFTEPLLAALPLVDILFGNESEAEALGEKLGLADKSVKNVALELSKMAKTGSGSRMVVITQGSESTVVAQDGKVTEYAVPKLTPEQIVDVNGAGDSFVGGFLASLLKGKNIQSCVDAGHYAASVILGVSGCCLPSTPPYAGGLLGLGNPLLDISADVGQDVLDKYGLTMNNAVLAEEKHMPLYKELVDSYKVQYIAGGATQNTIRVAQWMTQKAGSTSYIGCVGKDKFGEQLKNCAEADGVAVHYLEDAETPTGTCAVLINEKERSLVANLSAANKYSKDHFDTAAVQEVVGAAQIVYSAGFFLTVSPPTVQAVGEHCNKNNKVSPR
jgi:sugar/nucleoside kinase (ribokinase family)